MSKAKSKKKVVALSAVVASSVALTSYAVLSNAANTKIDNEKSLNLNIDKIDRDTVKISVSNLSESVKSLQLGLKIDGNAKFKSEESINWLLKNSDNIQKNINISGSGQYLDVVLVSNDELEKNGSTIDICEIDVSEIPLSKTNGYRIVPITEESSYTYVATTTNKSKSGNDFVNPSEELMKINNAPTISLKEGEIEGATIKGNTIEIEEGYDFAAKYKSFVETNDTDNDEVQVSYEGKVDTSISNSYNIKLVATDKPGDKTELDVIVKVKPLQVTELPTITGVKESHTMYAGEVFSPMEGISAKDAKGNTLDVVLSGDFDLNEAGEYTLTYTAKDKWGNVATETTKLTVVKDEAPVIKGIEDKTIEKGEAFDPLDGVTVTDDKDEDIQDKLQVSGEVNNKIAKDYKLSYSVTDSAGNTTKAQRTITVKPKVIEAPSINTVPVISGAKDITIKVGDTFDPMSGVTASDKEDGDLTEDIKVTGKVDTSKAGKYELVYTVKDKQGAKSSVSVTITVEENIVQEPPINEVPIISGAKDRTIKVGDTFDPMSGVTASDKEDGDLTKDIKVTGKVDTSKAGKYELVYTVKDKQGAKSSITVTITVLENESQKPEVKPEIPGSISDLIDSKVMQVLSGNGKSETPLVTSLNKITLDDLNEFLKELKDYNPTIEKVYTDGDETVFKIKLNANKQTPKLFRALFRSSEEVYMELRVKNEYTNLIERLNEFKEEITIEYTNTLPVINASNITIKVGDKFDPMSGVIANDKEDGDLTKDIKVTGTVDTSKPGEYKLTYSVTDKANATVSIVRTITVVEENTNPVINNIPVINLSDLVIKVGTDFDPMTGVTATDIEDGNITKNIKVTGKVDTSKAGKYKLTYSVTDSQGATVSAERTITVVGDLNEYEIPKTGDASILGYIGLASVAVGGIFINRKRRK